MNFLAIDASTEACSVAIKYLDQQFSEYELCPQSHSLRLLPMVDSVLKQANCTLTELDGIIFGQGPGSFTGVRIGIGVTQGLAFSAQLNARGVSTLQAMAQQAYDEKGQDKVIAAIDARMSEVYTCYFEVNQQGIMQAMTEEAVLNPELVAQYYSHLSLPAYGVGTGWEAYSVLSELKSNEAAPDILFPSAVAMLTIGQVDFSEHSVAAEHAQPKYVRDTVSWKKLPGRE
ncbi:tRNA (adenosine(37)-N6)-threonylcarbamoyltransferase complex dimerization subunit type 1 TsaB [Cognaticolwellia aestuarii]|uniref:tRNA (adenosine(37)-N6)-threonylcarbamoyltransferase complex dimerization subunit type 1 TsaB n=1 Tax=Cognaticolwellia aestuarii TaxID=329993 RepID=UPI00079C9DB7|nr:tRNA (adenosine(37)-N6)-threonylcarbamoyltransferase complex dimerization subunit type 1 TsaB [Cognaticolwellia aestuarii]KXJ52135.1 MAG: tRNA threonylcarbamoyladenosine biosynthesis protein TsaB [Colwellia sp. Phe_37]